TNGLGGFASGTVAGIATRRYHGLLVAALTPPARRTLLVGALDEWVVVGGSRYPLSTHEWADGTMTPQGYRFLERFHLDGQLPVWTFAIEDLLIERRVWMVQGANTTCISYRVARGERPVVLDVTPL